MAFVKESVTVGGKEISIETGKWAKQAAGSVVMRLGETMVLVTAAGSKGPREGMDFLPLTCEYQEKFYATGKIPGSYFRREGRSTEAEILIARLMDRPIRPLFPKGFRIDTQVIATTVSFDRENPPDVLAVTGASAALHMSDLPWEGPIAAVRLGRIDGKLVPFPTFGEREVSEIDLVVAASRDAIVMVEGEMKEVSETVIIDALMAAHEFVQPLLDLQEKLRAAVGKNKRVFAPPAVDAALKTRVQEMTWSKISSAMAVRDKHARGEALSAVGATTVAELCVEGAVYAGRAKEVAEAVEACKKKFARLNTLETQRRIDGRRMDEIRTITCEVGVLPCAHGSALFTRGETQSLVTTTLGTKQDTQRLESLMGERKKHFLLHYNFPPYSTGEVKPLRGSSRREVGHSFLAERSVEQIIPSIEDFPYIIRVVSDILESNGSSSMATVCGASLSMMDAGVPIKDAVAGIAMGLMKEGDRYAVLSDILGDEDHLGDMDFKVTGTRKGICALQMDIKLSGLTRQILVEALAQAKAGRLHILDKMALAIETSREELSPNAPRINTMQVKPDKVRDIIGPGGKTIRAIVEQTGAQIDIDDAGVVTIASPNRKSLARAQDLIRGLTMDAEVGAYYQGIVKRIVEFGAFVEILPGTDGLIHISELADERTRKVTDIVKEGDEVVVKCLSVDRDGKIRLSRKEALGVAPEEVLHFLT